MRNNFQHQMFEIRDYRNARYQGEMKNDKPNGIGIVIDYNYLFCLAEWQDGKINGAACVVFPDSRIFCGRIFNNELSGLCSFFLQDRIQIYANYSQKQHQKKNFIAILPFCKVLLQIDRNGPQPKVCHHETYNLEQNSLSSKLIAIFGNQFDLSEFQSWIVFLYRNFIKPFPKKLYWKEIVGNRSEEIFFGLKYQGLGTKIINLLDQKELMVSDGDCFVVASMGSYSNQHQLRGLGKQLVQYSKYKMQEEGQYGQRKSEIFQYPRKNRPIKGEKFFVNKLKSSFNFNNTFFDLKLFYDLLNKYEKINVELMEENRKIAQIIIQKNDDSVILAQIQNKKSRKLTPQKTQREIQSEYRRVKEPKERSQLIKMKEIVAEGDKMGRSSSQLLSVNPEAKKSIYSSAQKIKKFKNSPTKTNQTIFQRYKAPNYQYQEPSSFQNYNLDQSTPYIYQKKQKKIERQHRTLSKNGESKKYLYQTILENPNSLNQNYLQAKAQKSQKSFEKSTYIPSSNYDSRQKNLISEGSKYNPTIKKNERQRSSFYSRRSNFNEIYPSQSRSRQQSPPLLKRYNKSKQTKDPQNQNLINYFNKKIEEQYPSYSQLNKGYIYNGSKNNSNWTLGNTPKRQKTPGKIVTFKKKTDQNSIYK